MRFAVSHDDNIVILELFGDLVADSDDDMIRQVKTLTVEKKYIVLDMTNVGFMDSSGLRACMQVHALLAEKGGLAVYAHLSESVGRVFSITKADQRLIIAHSRPAAIKKLKFAMPGRAEEDDDGSADVLKLRLGRNFSEISSARAALREYCESRFMEREHRASLDDLYLAATEAMNNAVEHSGSKYIGIAVGAAGDVIIFKMVTPGARFDPTAKRMMPDLESAGELPEGGFGLAIIQELMDSVTYDYADGKNILTLKKIIRNKKEATHGI